MNDLFGLIGRKLGHSYSPQIHDRLFQAMNRDAYYHLFQIEPEMLETSLRGLAAVGAVGVNVTIPYKCDVIPYMDTLSNEAAAIGAVNTIRFDHGKMHGCNTDYFGFQKLLDVNKIPYNGKNVTILGNGGAADAVLQFFLDQNCKNIKIVTRSFSQTMLKYSNKDVIICKYTEIHGIKEGGIIVNCTPCGMYPHTEESPVEPEVLQNYEAAVDLIYNPTQTLFLKHAQRIGIPAVNGLYMLVGQAVAAEELWNNVSIDSQVIDKIYQELANEVSLK